MTGVYPVSGQRLSEIRGSSWGIKEYYWHY